MAPCEGGSFTVPLVTHGFEQSTALGGPDHFLLKTTQTFTAVSPSAGVDIFPVNNTTFGSNPGFPGTSLSGLSASAPGKTIRALSCLDDFWDINFYLATKGATDGDMLTLFLQNTDGSKTVQLAMFTIQGGQAILNSVIANGSVHRNDRNANGFSTMNPGGFNDRAPFSEPAGSAGKRTQLLTLAFPMLADSPTRGCFFLGFDLKRANGEGATSIVFNDLVVQRNELPGDRLQPGTGLVTGIGGGYPTGERCDKVCPPCTPTGGEEGSPGKCHTVRFLSPDYWQLRVNNPSTRSSLCRINVVIGGHNFNIPVNVCRSNEVVVFALKGGRAFGVGSMTPLQQLNREFVAAQLSFEFQASGPVRIDVLWGNLNCYGSLPSLTNPVILSNGAILTSGSMLKELYEQTLFALKEVSVNPMNAARQDDLLKLAAIWSDLNNDSVLGNCY